MDATNDGQTFARWLREQMITHGYQMEGPRAGGPSLLARQIGVHRASISRIFTQGAIPKPATLEAIADQFGIPKTEALIAAGIITSGELTSSLGPPETEPEAYLEPELEVDALFPGGLRNQHEETIWAMADLPWQVRHATIETMRREARRMAARATARSRPTRRPA